METDLYKTPDHRSSSELDKLYWESMRKGELVPLYGNNINLSLFESDVVDEWNLSNLPVLQEFFTDQRPDRSSFEGIFTPYLYMGSWRSSFPMHTEDLDSYSVNILHFGAEKVWFFVPRKYLSKLKECLPDYYKKCAIFEVDVMNFLKIPVLKAVQKPGEIIITFPNGAHQGYNRGFNCAEAVNYCSRQWVKYGMAAHLPCKHADIPDIDIDKVVQAYEPGNLHSNLFSFHRFNKI